MSFLGVAGPFFGVFGPFFGVLGPFLGVAALPFGVPPSFFFLALYFCEPKLEARRDAPLLPAGSFADPYWEPKFDNCSISIFIP